jgi:DNA-binding MarR family transcriptional regulator
MYRMLGYAEIAMMNTGRTYGYEYHKMKRNERIRIGFLIHDVSRLRRTAFDQRMKPLGITRSQWWVLSGVSRHGDSGITQTELAKVLDLGKVALGGLIDRLEERGYVQRHADPQDRRVNRVYLTRKGKAMLDRMAHVGLEMNGKIMKGVSLERQHLLAELLLVMKKNLIAMDVVPGSNERRKGANGANGGDRTGLKYRESNGSKPMEPRRPARSPWSETEHG